MDRLVGFRAGGVLRLRDSRDEEHATFEAVPRLPISAVFVQRRQPGSLVVRPGVGGSAHLTWKVDGERIVWSGIGYADQLVRVSGDPEEGKRVDGARFVDAMIAAMRSNTHGFEIVWNGFMPIGG